MAEAIDIRELNERIERQSAFVTNLMAGMDQVIVGQKHLIESLLIGLLSDGHILLEGVPGLAKTLAIKTLSSLIDAKYSRIQFTPDLLPADVIGTLIYSQKDEQFIAKRGPIFANFVLADEINRAPAKVQSALLEAMQERQVTLSKETFDLPKPFLVMATQNPIEQEGTYPLPEAQVDRFMLKVIIDYPKLEEEKKIIRQNISGEKIEVRPILKSEDIIEARKVVRQVYLDEKINDKDIKWRYRTISIRNAESVRAVLPKYSYRLWTWKGGVGYIGEKRVDDSIQIQAYGNNTYGDGCVYANVFMWDEKWSDVTLTTSAGKKYVMPPNRNWLTII